MFMFSQLQTAKHFPVGTFFLNGASQHIEVLKDRISTDGATKMTFDDVYTSAAGTSALDEQRVWAKKGSFRRALPLKPSAATAQAYS
jgi:hypothetical protein